MEINVLFTTGNFTRMFDRDTPPPKPKSENAISEQGPTTESMNRRNQQQNETSNGDLKGFFKTILQKGKESVKQTIGSMTKTKAGDNERGWYFKILCHLVEFAYTVKSRHF